MIRPDRNDDEDNPYGCYRLDGLYWAGPLGMRCSLAILIAASLLRVTGSSTHGMRKAQNAEKSRDMLRRALNWQRGSNEFPPRDPEHPLSETFRAVLIVHAEKDDRERRTGRSTKLGRFHIPAGKRPNSGRKRRVAA